MVNQQMKEENLKKIFYPSSIAVVGANKIAGTVPHDILVNFVRSGFQGVVYPVNPKAKAIASMETYKYVLDIKNPVDLAVIVYPSSVVDLALEQCGQKGIKSVIIISAGFKEVGEVGLERERKLMEIAAKYNISFIGPNCLGVINTDPAVNLNASFARRMPEEGSIGFLSQSGALCTAVLDYAFPRHIGFSKFVSFGNKADLSELDLLQYLKNDEKTKVILLYLEEISDGRALMQISREIIFGTGKPILLLKSGRTAEGARAAASHTGSLAGSDKICDAALRQAGIIRCENIEEMFNKAIGFAYQPLPANKRIAIITNAGGPGVLATDSVIKQGLQMASFTDKTTAILAGALPKTANIKNPVDVIGDARAERYRVALSSTLEDHNVDGVLVILTPQSMTNIESIAHEVTLIAGKYDKPVYTSFMGEMDVAGGIDILQKNKIPHYRLPESMAEAFSATYRFRQEQALSGLEIPRFPDVNKGRAHSILDGAFKAGRQFITEDESVNVLEAFGLPVPDHGVASSREEAVTIAEKIGYPVVMKILSDDIIHKTDVKGVVLNLRDRNEVQAKYDEMLGRVKCLRPAARIKGVFISRMLEKGEELILGMKKDIAFGPVLMFGMGGIFVEIFEDVNFNVAPVNTNEVKRMITGIKSFPVLAGSRGREVSDIESLEQCIHRLSYLAMECPQIKELDINPLMIFGKGKGCFVADTKIMV
ncbi:MAG: acetate--CoA ligase family protein [bacterium]|nr:acetate--CoA ligase family protein [bacterium]